MNLPSLAIEPLSKAAFGPFGTVIERDGADIIDIGGESTRPYSDPVGVNEVRG
mgnify:CR=1 FL=1